MSAIVLIVLVATACGGTPRHLAGAPAPAGGSVGTMAPPARLSGVRMLSVSTGWAWGWRGGRLSLWRTSDGGERWTEVSAPSVTADPSFASITGVADFPTAREGIVAALASNGIGPLLEVFSTVDGGRTWKKVHDAAFAEGGALLSLQMVTPRDGYLLASAGFAMQREQKTLLRTTDGGRTWQVASSDTGYVPWPRPTSSALPEEGDVRTLFRPDGTGFAGTTVELETPSFIGLYRSTNFGATWRRVALALPPGLASQDYTVTQAPVMDGEDGTLIVAVRGKDVATLTYRTSDGGASWTLASRLNAMFLAAGFSSSESGLLFSTDGRAWRTSDGGGTWTEMPLPAALARSLAAGDTIAELDALSPTVAWMVLLHPSTLSAADDVTTLFVTHDGGRAWTSQALGN